jgi:ubiquinone biosynthesis protein COQ9
MTTPTMTREDAIDAYLDFFAARGFGPATVAAVAEHCDAHPSALVDALGDRWAALDAFTRRLDRAGVAATDGSGSVRDRLFDMAMARFDAAQPHRSALAALDAETRRRPALGVALLATLPRTSALLLSAAGANTIGIDGLVRVQAFAAILADAGRVWMSDADVDQGETMRALDRRLDQAERLMARLGASETAGQAPTLDLAPAQPASAASAAI